MNPRASFVSERVMSPVTLGAGSVAACRLLSDGVQRGSKRQNCDCSFEDVLHDGSGWIFATKAGAGLRPLPHGEVTRPPRPTESLFRAGSCSGEILRCCEPSPDG